MEPAENQLQVLRRPHSRFEISQITRDFHVPTAPTTAAVVLTSAAALAAANTQLNCYPCARIKLSPMRRVLHGEGPDPQAVFAPGSDPKRGTMGPELIADS